MNEIKLVIEIRGKVVETVKSTVPLSYVIVDYDLLNVGEYPLSVPLQPDAIGSPLHTLYWETDNQEAEIREELKRIKF